LALRKNNIIVWYAPEDLKAGRKIDEEISNAIKNHWFDLNLGCMDVIP
jgi:hypothetical protein